MAQKKTNERTNERSFTPSWQIRDVSSRAECHFFFVLRLLIIIINNPTSLPEEEWNDVSIPSVCYQDGRHTHISFHRSLLYNSFVASLFWKVVCNKKLFLFLTCKALLMMMISACSPTLLFSRVCLWWLYHCRELSLSLSLSALLFIICYWNFGSVS